LHVEIEIKNYRCFPDRIPLRFEIKDGFTAFVGVNNAGKSSILKFFYEFRSLFQSLAHPDNLVTLLRGNPVGFRQAQNVKDLSELFSDSNERDLFIQFSFPANGPTTYSRPSSITLFVSRNSTSFQILNVVIDHSHFKPNARCAFVDQGNLLVQLQEPALQADFRSVFEVLNHLAGAFYIGAFRNAINIGAKDDYFDIAVGQSFVKLWREYKTGNVKKHNELIKQVTRDIGFIFDLELEVNATPDDQTFQIYVGGNSFKLNELGAGIAQFIHVLSTVAIRNPTFVLIDEPELNLHPSLQLSFLTTLASYSKNGVVFSTHSIGLARAIGDRIYSVRRLKQGESQVAPIERIPHYAEFLGELSFNGYQELGFDRILLVEGSTEVRTVQQFLRLLKIDHQIVLLPLGGSGMINGTKEQELVELKRISNNIGAIIDSEKTSKDMPLEKSREEFIMACKRADIACHVLERRATENYFTDSAVKRIMGDKYRALQPYEKLNEANLHWAKADNWRIARQMNLNDLAGTDLLQFLETLRQ
jgi:ABC-type cobalamin/Fe3+-siderophores transport system ATPase subunit